MAKRKTERKIGSAGGDDCGYLYILSGLVVCLEDVTTGPE